MERLSGLDATFLYLETPGRAHARSDDRYLRHLDHARRVLVRGRSATTSSGGSTESRRSPDGWSRCRFACTTPSGSRIRTSMSSTTSDECAVPAPGGPDRELAEMAAHIASIPLDRTPSAVGGVGHRGPENRTASASWRRCTMRRSTGASGAEIMTELYDLEPSPPPRPVPEPAAKRKRSPPRWSSSLTRWHRSSDGVVTWFPWSGARSKASPTW